MVCRTLLCSKLLVASIFCGLLLLAGCSRDDDFQGPRDATAVVLSDDCLIDSLYFPTFPLNGRPKVLKFIYNQRGLLDRTNQYAIGDSGEHALDAYYLYERGPADEILKYSIYDSKDSLQNEFQFLVDGLKRIIEMWDLEGNAHFYYLYNEEGQLSKAIEDIGLIAGQFWVRNENVFSYHGDTVKIEIGEAATQSPGNLKWYVLDDRKNPFVGIPLWQGFVVPQGFANNIVEQAEVQNGIEVNRISTEVATRNNVVTGLRNKTIGATASRITYICP